MKKTWMLLLCAVWIVVPDALAQAQCKKCVPLPNDGFEWDGCTKNYGKCVPVAEGENGNTNCHLIDVGYMMGPVEGGCPYIYLAECPFSPTVNCTTYIPPGGDGNTNEDDPCPGGGGQCGGSPIVLSFERNWNGAFCGLDDPVTFDLNGDGVPQLITWTARGKRVGFLVIDRSGNGLIDNGKELFGDAEAINGWEYLRAYDQNGDWSLDEDDGNLWPRLQIWIDANHNASTDAGELTPLSAWGIQRFDLDYKRIGRRDNEGNFLRYVADVWRNGKKEKAFDVYFRGVN